MHQMYFKHLPPLLSAILLLFWSSLSHTALAALPDLGAPDLVAYDEKTEKKLGDAFSTILHNQYPLLEDPASLSMIRSIGHQLSQQVSPPRPFTFYLIQAPEINAFAGPNGIIGINTGLILKADTEDEVAAVLAHEIAHITQQHISRTLQNQTQVNLTNFASLLAAILIGSQDPSAGFAAYLGGTSLNLQQQLKNSRIHETEADSIGMQYLSSAGYNPHAMGSFFSKLSQAAQLNRDTPPEILSTHPVTQRRLAEAENRANQLPTQPSHNALTFELLKTRIQTLSQHSTALPSSTVLSTTAQCYQKNLLWLQQSPPKAKNPDLNCLKTALKQIPQHLYLRLLYAQILTQLNQTQAAQEQYALLYNLYPHNSALLNHYSQFLAQHQHPQKAITLLSKALKTNATDNPYLLYQTLGKIHTEQQQTAEAYYAQAKAYQSIGNQKRYQYLLRQAQAIVTPKQKALQKKLQQELTLTKQRKKEDKSK